MRVARWPDQWVCTHLEGFRGTAGAQKKCDWINGMDSLKRGGNAFYIVPSLLTVSGPHDLRLVLFHSGVNDDGAAQTQCFTFTAKGHFEFVNNGCFECDAMLSAETICRAKIKKLKTLLLKYLPNYFSVNNTDIFFLCVISLHIQQTSSCD